MSIIKKYIEHIYLSEGILKVPEKMLYDITEYVLNQFSIVAVDLITSEKSNILNLKKESERIFPNEQINQEDLNNIKNIIDSKKPSKTSIKLPSNSSKEIKNFEVYIEKNNIHIAFDEDYGDTEYFSTSNEGLESFVYYVNSLIEEQKRYINFRINYLIDIISLFKTKIKNSELELSKKFKYKDTFFTVSVSFHEDKNIFTKNERGHYDSSKLKINLNLFYYMKEIEPLIESGSDQKFIIEIITDIKELINHELKHLIQFTDKKNVKVGLPGSKEKTPVYSQNNDDQLESHILDDYEFQTNIGSVIIQMKKFLSSINKDFRIMVFKLLVGNKIKVPALTNEFSQEQTKKLKKVNEFIDYIFKYFGSNTYKDSYAFYNLSVMREKAPHKYKKYIKEIYKELSSQIEMGDDILKSFPQKEYQEYKLK